ncbi:transposase [Streptomyces sp. MNP-20]|uniref:transposase n=1 Tax=Streptomyces sp. MNP-20 TaxID=2721165 RepID=UPI0015519971|nr:transposase [Streptomyces sp. MNP-20]
MRHPDTLNDSQRDQLDRILEACPDLATARALDHGPSPVRGFAAFLQNDGDAVVNGHTLPWSSGAVEGQVTRIKLIKRRSYGCTSFALLRTPVLAQLP